MTFDQLRIVLTAILTAAFVVQSVAIVFGVYYFRVVADEFLKKFATYLDLAARHASVTSQQAATLTESVKAEVRRAPQETARVILETQAKAGVPVPPAPPDEKTNPNAGERQAAPKGVLWGLLGGAMLSAFACGPVARYAERYTETVMPKIDDVGLAAMRKRNHAEAEAAFLKANDLPRLAESYYYAGRDADALAVCDKLGDTGRAAYIRGLVRLRSGDRDLAETDLRRAVELGEWKAATLLRPEHGNDRKGTHS